MRARSPSVTAVVLMAGSGSRLLPLTAGVNKAFMPVFDRSLIQNAVRLINLCRVDQVLIVCNAEEEAQVRRHLAGEPRFPDQFVAVSTPRGTAESLYSCRSVCESTSDLLVLLSDNVFQVLPSAHLAKDLPFDSCSLLLAWTREIRHFGVANFKQDRITSVTDKPSLAGPGWVVTGLMRFSNFFERYDSVRWAGSGERDLMDVVRLYLSDGRVSCSTYEHKWFDAGVSPSCLLAASQMAQMSGGLNLRPTTLREG